MDQGVEPKRLARSFAVDIYDFDEEGDALPPFHYMAITEHGPKGTSVHYLFTDPHVHCDCEDFTWHGQRWLCKHLIAALMEEGNPHVEEKATELGFT